MRKKQIVKLIDIYKKIPEEKQEMARDLIKEIEFMSKTLDILKETITQDGAVEMFEQGKQKFMRESPAMKAYNSTIKQYGAMLKQLLDLVPKKDTNPQENDGFDDFVSERYD